MNIKLLTLAQPSREVFSLGAKKNAWWGGGSWRVEGKSKMLSEEEEGIVQIWVEESLKGIVLRNLSKRNWEERISSEPRRHLRVFLSS
jgi:hypothetical protein